MQYILERSKWTIPKSYLVSLPFSKSMISKVRNVFLYNYVHYNVPKKFEFPVESWNSSVYEINISLQVSS